jgi:hypothetical protein
MDVQRFDLSVNGRQSLAKTPHPTRWAALVLVLALLTTCTEPQVNDWQGDLARAEVLWRAAGVTSYEMDIVMTCYCLEAQTRPVTSTVRDSAFVSLVYTDSGGSAADTTLFRRFMMMDRVFTAMHEVLDAEPASLYAEYDPAYGFPTLWSVDPDGMMVDEEFTFQVLAFRRLSAAAR